MAFTRTGAVSHAVLPGVTATQHHTATVAGDLNHQDLAARGVSDHHTATVAGDLSLANMAVRAHANLSDAPADAHHAQAHQANHDVGGSDPIAQMCHIATGTYTGDGATSQGITGLGFQPKFVLITERKTTDNSSLRFEADLFTTDVIVDDNAAGGAITNTSDLHARFMTDAIISLDADGFSVDDDGADNDPNTNAIVYNFLALG